MENKNQKKEKAEPGHFQSYKKKKKNIPKVEASPEYENKGVIRTERYNILVLLVIIFTIIFVVAVLVYSLYSFLSGSGITNIAGVHITNNLKKMVYQILEGRKISELGEEIGYENWLEYRGEGYFIKYPPDWKLEESDTVRIRKYNRKTYGYFDSLAATIELKKWRNENNLELADFLKQNELEKGENKLITLSDKEALRTGVYSDSQGFIHRSVYWKIDDKEVLQLDARFYNDNYKDLFGDFEKIVLSVEFY